MTHPPNERLRIAYLCDQDPGNTSLYSGGNSRILAALQDHVGDVHVLSQGWHMAEPIRRLVEALPDKITIRARWRLHLMLSRLIARGVNAQLAAGQFDVLFGAYSFHALRHVSPPAGTITAYTSDATPTTYRDSEIGASFGSYLSLSRGLDPWIKRQETQVFQNTDLLLWPTDWLRDAANRAYGLDGAKAVTIPWGANIPDPGEPDKPISLRRDAPIQLLVLGRDWFAKGGPTAFDAMQILRGEGVDARLTVIGTTPPDFHMSEHVTVHPYLDKSNTAQFETFQSTLRNAHFMVMPSYESYGFAFCEASAYGLPSLCLRVGGVPVRDGINGHALPISATPQDFAQVIRRYLKRPETYNALRQSSRREYKDHLNWNAWGKAVAAKLHTQMDQ